MGDPIQVVHLGQSTLAGRRSSHGAGTIRIGRSPENDIVFDAHRDRLVSGQHLELRRLEGGRLQIRDLGATNGTYVDGMPLRGEALLARGARVELGRGGPLLTAWLGPDDDTVPLVAPAPIVSPPEPTQPPSFFERVRSSFLRRRDPPTAKAPARPGVGMDTLLSVLSEHRARERRARILIVVALLAVIGGVAAWLLTRPPRTRTIERTETVRTVIERQVPAPTPVPVAVAPAVTPPPPDRTHAGAEWQQVLEQVRERVYLVVTVDPKTGLGRKHGTAFSLDAERGLLATNAQVARIFAEKKPDAILLARSSSDPPLDLHIESVRIHPGYQAFTRDAYRYRPLGDSAEGFRSFVNPYDVALLQVREADRVNQAPELPLRDRAGLLGLTGGEELATAGFPVEGQAAGGTDLGRPASQSSRFTLSRVTTPFVGRPERAEDGQMLTYSTASAGGARGSPVVDDEGRVVGLVSAGDLGSFGREGPSPGGGTSYGPRADLLRELVDGTAQTRARVRAARDRASFKRLWGETKPTDWRIKGAALHFTRHVGNRERGSDVTVVREETLTASVGKPAAFQLRLEPGLYGLFFASLDEPIGLKMRLDGTWIERGSWFVQEPLSIRSATELTVPIGLVPESADQFSGRVTLVVCKVVD